MSIVNILPMAQGYGPLWHPGSPEPEVGQCDVLALHPERQQRAADQLELLFQAGGQDAAPPPAHHQLPQVKGQNHREGHYQKEWQDRILSTMKRFDNLSPTMFNELAKLIIAKYCRRIMTGNIFLKRLYVYYLLLGIFYD